MDVEFLFSLILAVLDHPDEASFLVTTGIISLVADYVAEHAAERLLKHRPAKAYIKRLRLLMLSIFCLAIGLYYSSNDITCAAYIAVIAVVSNSVLLYQKMNESVEAIASFNDQQNVKRNPTTALALLRDLNQTKLIGAQIERFEQYKIYTYRSLGNNKVLKELLEDEAKQKLIHPAFRHFFLHLIYAEACDFNQSSEELNKALSHKDDADADVFITLQIDHNQAVLHMEQGQCRTAHDELQKVLRRIDELGLRNKDFLNTVYTNYVLNLTRIGLPDGGKRDGQDAIDRYARYLNPADPADVLALFNLKIQFMRATAESPAHKNDLYMGALGDLTNKSLFTEAQRAVGTASLGGVCCFDHLDPTPIIEFFAADGGIPHNLSPADRFVVYSQLKNLIWAIERGALTYRRPIVDDLLLFKVAQDTERYFRTSAWNDLDEWERTLPMEAYRLRAQVLSEKAELRLEQGDETAAIDYMSGAINILESSMLVQMAIEYRLRLAKIMLENDQAGALEQVRIVEQQLAKECCNPAQSFIYAQVSLCYALTNHPDDCLRAYDLAVRSKVPAQLVAPHERVGLLVAAFCARFFLFVQTMERLKHDVDRTMLSTEAQTWLAKYPDVSSATAAYLLACFMGYEGAAPLKRRVLTAQDGSQSFVQCWLDFGEAGVAFDPTLAAHGSGSLGQVCLSDRHPWLTESDLSVRRYTQEGYVLLPMQVASFTEAMLDQADCNMCEEVGRALEEATSDAAPTVDDLKEVYRSTFGWGNAE